MAIPELFTERLLLRAWRPADIPVFAQMNADDEVMRHFPKKLTEEETRELVERIEQQFALQGFGAWAVEIAGGSPFIGFAGLGRPTWVSAFTPCVEIGWRLARAYWGYGYATEAARRILRFGFNELQLREIVSFTVPGNNRSRAVMERLGMTRDPAEDFEHPKVPEGHPFRRHVLYRLKAEDFASKPRYGTTAVPGER